MHKILLVGVGGFTGAITRYISLAFAARFFGSRSFPFGTMLVNITGCFLLGLGLGLATSREILSPETRLLLFTGFLGSFTTYSTFGYETFILAREGSFFASVLNIVFHIIIGLAAVWAGDYLSRLV